MPQLSSNFVRLNSVLRAADTPEQWRPAAEVMGQFLDKLEHGPLQGDRQIRWNKYESASLFSILLTIMAETGQYRLEQVRLPVDGSNDPARLVADEYLPEMGKLRQRAIELAKVYLQLPVFRPLHRDIELEINPLLHSMDPGVAPDRYMPFRVIQIANVVERLYGFRLRTDDPYLAGTNDEAGLLQEIYDRKYLRFGTSGVRGRWGYDFTEVRAKQVVQAICDFLTARDAPSYVNAENLQGRRIVVGYDSRRNGQLVAEWVAQVCVGNGFRVEFANRDTPTPALVYYLLEELASDEVAGLINCTASHNPPEWQGIKFNPRLGYPAATNVTDFVAARVNELQLLGEGARVSGLADAEASGNLRGFDPISAYTQWILNSGRGNNRVQIDHDRIRNFFKDRLVVVDEMHGAGRGYLTRILGEIGVRHTVLHGEQDPDIPGLDYANPEEPYVDDLKETVRESNAVLGLALDTDADRFGIVDRGGQYFRPNQVLPMLVRYLAIDRGLEGRVVSTQTGSPLIEILAGKRSNRAESTPSLGTIPPYIAHPFYHLVVGTAESRIYEHTFLVPVGIKYIEEQRRTDRAYRPRNPMPENWRDTILLGGEESSGLSTRGHVPDKDGIWGDLLVMDMLAYYGSQGSGGLNSVEEIWNSTTAFPGCWNSYGGSEHRGSNTGRADIDAVLEAKEELINFYLDQFVQADTSSKDDGFQDMATNLSLVYLGGVRYDVVEMQFRDTDGDDRHYLRVRASGTEPINRIYVESSDPEIASRLIETVLTRLEILSVDQVAAAGSEWRLVDILAMTAQSDRVLNAVRDVIERNDGTGWSLPSVVAKLQRMMPTLERRNQNLVIAWIDALCSQ